MNFVMNHDCDESEDSGSEESGNDTEKSSIPSPVTQLKLS